MKKGNKMSALKGTTSIRDLTVTPVLNARVTDGIVRESQVDILYMLDPNDERLIRVKVWSKVRRGLFRFTDIPCAGHTEREMQAKCGIAAGAIAEQLIALYGDTVEPSECAKSAGQHFSELVKYLEQQRTARKSEQVAAEPEEMPEAQAVEIDKLHALSTDDLRRLGESSHIAP
jgi:hypothetical protein